MSNNIKKQAAKVASKAIELANEKAKATVAENQAERQELLQKIIAESDLAREVEGKDAMSNLRRLGGNKLPRGEEVIIARHFYDELPALKRHLRDHGNGIGWFCTRFGISDASESSKELHRLTLPPGKNPTAVRLRRSAAKYFELIKAISKTTNESSSTLADRILRGTSLHPNKMVENLSETEKVQAALQRIVNKIDEEFNIHAKFMEIAELKAQHIAAGGKEHWPLWDVSRDYLSPEEYEHRMVDATNKRFAFWKNPFDQVDPVNAGCVWPMAQGSGALQDTEFFYVPHAPLGVVEFANLPDRRVSPAQYEEAVQSSLEWWRGVDTVTGQSWVAQECSINDDWDIEKKRPVGQMNFNPHHHLGTSFAWIIMYPMPDGSRLMPMLYISYQEGGPFMMPLDARNLDIFREAIWLNETDHMSVFDRIKELLGYRPGTPRVIEDGFRRTAPWLEHNPHFKMRRQNADDLQLLDTYCHQLWEEK